MCSILTSVGAEGTNIMTLGPGVDLRARWDVRMLENTSGAGRACHCRQGTTGPDGDCRADLLSQVMVCAGLGSSIECDAALHLQGFQEVGRATCSKAKKLGLDRLNMGVQPENTSLASSRCRHSGLLSRCETLITPGTQHDHAG
jgi:hypothetical protein